MTRVKLLEWGANTPVGEIQFINHTPSVGDYIIPDDDVAQDGWKDRMYIVRAVTHFKNDLIAVHVEKYNSDEQEIKWKKATEYWENVIRRNKLELQKLQEDSEG